MGILTKLERGAAEQKSGLYGGETLTLTNQKLGEFFGGGTHTGKSVTDSTALQITTVWACIRLLAETMGAMPSGVFQREKNGNAVKVDHALSEVLIHQPNSDMNGLECREARTSNLALRGNSYALMEHRGDGNVSSLYPVPAATTRRKRDSSTNWETKYGVQDRGKTEWYPAEKIWHVKGFSFNGLEGLSPISYAREAMALALAGEEFNSRLFGQGLSPSARVSIPEWLTPEQRRLANQKLMEMHSGLHNMNKPMLLEGGMKVESGLLTPDDAQFLQLRQFTVVELCRLFGVKPHMIAALERATDNNIEKLSLEFVTYTMLPYIRREEEAARKLFKPGDRDKFFYRYNFEGLLRADSAARAALYSILLQNGVASRNQVRALENWNQIDDPAMDQFTIQSNMAMIDQIAALVAARSAPMPPPADERPPEKSAAPVQIHLTSFEEAIGLVAKALDGVRTGQQEMTAAVAELAKSHDGLHDATVVLARETAKTARQTQGIAGSIDSSLESIKAASLETSQGAKDVKDGITDLIAAQRLPRKAVFDGDGNVIGSEVVDDLR